MTNKEIEVMKGLNHPNIIEFYGVYSPNESTKYLVLEYVSDGSLDVYLRVHKDQIQDFNLIDFSIKSKNIILLIFSY